MHCQKEKMDETEEEKISANKKNESRISLLILDWKALHSVTVLQNASRLQFSWLQYSVKS